jgi:hypothetical protein
LFLATFAAIKTRLEGMPLSIPPDLEAAEASADEALRLFGTGDTNAAGAWLLTTATLVRAITVPDADLDLLEWTARLSEEMAGGL